MKANASLTANKRDSTTQLSKPEHNKEEISIIKKIQEKEQKLAWIIYNESELLCDNKWILIWTVLKLKKQKLVFQSGHYVFHNKFKLHLINE